MKRRKTNRDGARSRSSHVRLDGLRRSLTPRAPSRKTSYLFVASALLAIACGASSPLVGSVAPLPCPAGGLDVAQRSKTDTTIHPLALFLPPLPAPRVLYGHRAVIRVMVDSAGKGPPDSTVVCGIGDTQYARKVA